MENQLVGCVVAQVVGLLEDEGRPDLQWYQHW